MIAPTAYCIANAPQKKNKFTAVLTRPLMEAGKWALSTG